MIDTALTKSIRVKQIEAAYLTKVLDLWAAAEAQGINSMHGGSFGLDTRLFTERDRREWQRHRDRFLRREVSGATHPLLFNYFRYPDGRVVTLNPMLEAVYRE